MKLITKNSLRGLGAVSLAMAAGLAQAHTGHGTSGLAEGLAHPLGADHLLAMLAVGLWSVKALPDNKAWQGPVTFLLTLVLSASLGAMGVTLPLLEPLIALSVVLFGALLILNRQQLPTAAGLGLVALAASLHGLAHGAEAPVSGFAGYAAAFLLTTAALHAGGLLVGLGLRRHLAEKSTWAMGALGSLFGASGLYLFTQL